MRGGLADIYGIDVPAVLAQFLDDGIFDVVHRDAVEPELGGVRVIVVDVLVLLLERGVVAVEVADKVLYHAAVLDEHRVEHVERIYTVALVELTDHYPVNEVVVVECHFQRKTGVQVAVQRAVLHVRQVVEVGAFILRAVHRAAHHLLALLDGDALVDGGAVVVDVGMAVGVEVAIEALAALLRTDIQD